MTIWFMNDKFHYHKAYPTSFFMFAYSITHMVLQTKEWETDNIALIKHPGIDAKLKDPPTKEW